MSTPEATPEDVQEQQAALVAEPSGMEQDDLPAEASPADVADQRIEVPFEEDDTPIG